MKHHLSSPNCLLCLSKGVWRTPSDVQEVTSPIFTKVTLFFLQSLVYRLGETERRSSLKFWTDRSSASEVVLSSRTTQWPPNVAVPPPRSSRFLDKCAAANVQQDLKPSIRIHELDLLLLLIFTDDRGGAPDPGREPPDPHVSLTYLSYKLVCSEPGCHSRGQCTGLLPPILYYETSSLMRPNKLVLDEPKLPPLHPHHHTHTAPHHFHSLFTFALSPLLCAQSFVQTARIRNLPYFWPVFCSLAKLDDLQQQQQQDGGRQQVQIYSRS